MEVAQTTSADFIKVEIKEEFFEDEMTSENHVKLCVDATIKEEMETVTTYSSNLDTLTVMESFSDVKLEESRDKAVLLPYIAIPAHAPSLNCSRNRSADEQQENPEKSKARHHLLMLKKLLTLTLPKKNMYSRWNKRTTESVLKFLKSYAITAQGCSSSNSADRCIVLKGPRILKCEECFNEFSGLYDRYLELFNHYKTDHRSKCNMLIGRRWMKHSALLEVMIQAWKIDLKYDLLNLTSGLHSICQEM